MAPDSFPKITFCEYLGSRCLESVGSGRMEECIFCSVLPWDLGFVSLSPPAGLKMKVTLPHSLALQLAPSGQVLCSLPMGLVFCLKQGFVQRGIKVYSARCVCVCVCVCVYLVTQSCQTLCHTMDCSPLGSSVPGIFQARILEWGVIFSSRGSSLPRDWTHYVSCIGWGGFLTTSTTWGAHSVLYLSFPSWWRFFFWLPLPLSPF